MSTKYLDRFLSKKTGPKVSGCPPEGTDKTDETPCMQSDGYCPTDLGDMPRGALTKPTKPWVNPPDGGPKVSGCPPEGTDKTDETPCIQPRGGGFGSFVSTLDQGLENLTPPDGGPKSSGYPPGGTGETGETPCMQPDDRGFAGFAGGSGGVSENLTPPAGPLPWSQLQHQRWGPAIGDSEPGIVIERDYVRRPFDPAAERVAQDDPYAIVERACIRSERPGGGYEEPGWVGWARSLPPAQWDAWRSRAKQIEARLPRGGSAIERIERSMELARREMDPEPAETAP